MQADPQQASTPRARRRMGVIGSFVWDVIHGRDSRDVAVEEWGGISYALSALDAALPDDWEFVPIVKVGHDLAHEAREYLRGLTRVAADAAPVVVPVMNNRVELRYHSNERRSEILHGGVPPWSWLGLSPLVRDLDALYVNLISGFELDLDTARLIRQNFAGPIYCDLHSLLLAVQPDGLRTLRPLPDAGEWMECFDLVQVNEDELHMMAPDPLALAAIAMARGVKALTVTLGARGAVYFAAPGFDRLADLDRPLRREDPRPRPRPPTLGNVRTALIASEAPPDTGIIDPTGCGDVWGATYFSRLVAGDNLSVAMRAAHRAAARNVAHRGATRLAAYLRGELSLS